MPCHNYRANILRYIFFITNPKKSEVDGMELSENPSECRTGQG